MQAQQDEVRARAAPRERAVLPVLEPHRGEPGRIAAEVQLRVAVQPVAGQPALKALAASAAWAQCAA